MKLSEISVKGFLAVFIVVFGMNALVFSNISDAIQNSIVNLILLIIGYYFGSSAGSAAKDKATNEALAEAEKLRKEREEIALREAERVRLEREEADAKPTPPPSQIIKEGQNPVPRPSSQPLPSNEDIGGGGIKNPKP